MEETPTPEGPAGVPGIPLLPEHPVPPPPAAQSATTATAAEATAEPTVAVSRPPWWSGVWAGRIAMDVLLVLASASLFAGVIGLLAAKNTGFERNAIVTAIAFTVLAAIAVALRLVRGAEDVRGTIAFVALLFAPACFLFADDLADPTLHDNLVKICVAAGGLSALAAAAAVFLPSAVIGALSLVALATAIDLSVYLTLTSPTPLELNVSVLGLGLAIMMAVGRLPWLAPHTTGRGWLVGTSALLLVGPGLGEIAVTNDGVAIAAAACGGAALLLLAQRARNVAVALGALAIVGTVEGVLISRSVRPGAESTSTGSDIASAASITLICVGGVALILMGLACVIAIRRTAWSPRWRFPIHAHEPLLAAAFVLSMIALVTVPGQERTTPIVPQPEQNAPNPNPLIPPQAPGGSQPPSV